MVKKRGGKKAQLTLFVILGLVIIILFAIIYFGFIRKPVEKEEFIREAVPEEFKPVQGYVELCIHRIGVEAIKRMGAHGGYIDPLDPELALIPLSFDSSTPTESDLVSLTGEEEGAVPYYLHVPGRSNRLNYGLGSFAPTIESMEYQLSVFISRNLPACVGDFEELEERGFRVSADNDNISTGSFIRDDKIEIFVNYNLDVSKKDVKTKITRFKNIIRFPYKKYYDLAINFMVAELVTQFLEHFTKMMISYHSGVDFTMLPPPLARTNLPYVVVWQKPLVEQRFREVLPSYVPAMQVIGTRNYEPIPVPEGDIDSAFFNSLRLDIYNDSLPNIAITLYYTNQPISLRIQPSSGNTIRPSIEVMEENQFIPVSYDNTYMFFYDVAYPVIVEIRGYNEPEISEYSFLFALEENLIENKPVLLWNLGMGTVEWDYSYINTTFTFPEDSIQTPEGDIVPITPRSFTKSLLCEEYTWVSGNIGIEVVDEELNTPLEGASLGFGCGDYDECSVGVTNSSGEWKGKLPVCQGGYLSISKDGYGSKTVLLSTAQGQDEWLGIKGLYREREINVTAKKMQIQKTFIRDDWEWEEGPESLGPLTNIDENNEQLIITITQTGVIAGANPLSRTIIFGKDGVERETIKLVPGDYKVTGTLIDYNGFTIPAECSRVCTTSIPIIGCTSYTYYPSDSISVDTTPWGGVEINSSTTGFFRITTELDDYDEIEFHALRLPTIPPGCIEHLDEMGKIDEYSRRYRIEVMPDFK